MAQMASANQTIREAVSPPGATIAVTVNCGGHALFTV